MPEKVDIAELDLADANDLLTELNGKPSKEKKVAAARTALTAALAAKKMELSVDDEGNFVLEEAKAAPAKGKAKPAPAKAKAAPVEEEEEEEEEEDEEEEDEDEDDSEEEDEEEEEEEEAAPPPKAKGKAKPPAPAPAAKGKPTVMATKGKAKAAPVEEEDEEEDEDEEVKPTKKKAAASNGSATKRAPPTREPKYAPTQRIKVLQKDTAFRDGSGRAAKWELVKTNKTVGEFLVAAREAELATPSSYLAMCVKTGKISIT